MESHTESTPLNQPPRNLSQVCTKFHEDVGVGDSYVFVKFGAYPSTVGRSCKWVKITNF